MDRIELLIDGGNFYHLALKKLNLNELEFDFEKFAQFLINGRTLVENGKRYYIGTVPEIEGDKRSREQMMRQTKLFDELRKTKWEIKTSKLRKRLEELKIDERVINHKIIQGLGIEKIEFERLREKGIDVKLATDLIVGAVDNKYDIAIIVSSDGDLISAIDWVRRRMKKRIEYVGFSISDKIEEKKSTEPLLSMIKKTDIKRILIESDLRQFIISKLV
jgi:uncharacterized LabA/DUF88 family protein